MTLSRIELSLNAEHYTELVRQMAVDTAAEEDIAPSCILCNLY